MSSCRVDLGESEYEALSCKRLLIELLRIYSVVDLMVRHHQFVTRESNAASPPVVLPDIEVLRLTAAKPAKRIMPL